MFSSDAKHVPIALLGRRYDSITLLRGYRFTMSHLFQWTCILGTMKLKMTKDEVKDERKQQDLAGDAVPGKET